MAYTDETDRILDSRAPVTIRYGRDQARSLAPIAPGEASFTLDNIDRALSPENTSSPLYGQVIPARPVTITATNAGVSTVLFVGQLDDFTVVPGTDNRYVTATLIDALATLRGQTVSTGLYRGLRTGEALHVLLNAIGWPLGQRDIDPGATVMPYWWCDGDDAFDAVMDLLASEGPPSLVTVDTGGRIVFRGRHHRLQNTASTTVQATWRSGDPEPSISDPTDYNHGWKEIVNSVVFEQPQRGGTGIPSVVWQSTGLITVPAGQTLPVVAQASDPFFDAILPVQTTGYDENGVGNGDYTLVSGPVVFTLARTSGLSTTIFVSAPSGPVVLSDLQLRATALTTVSTVQVKVEDGASITRYSTPGSQNGRRTLPDERAPKWASLPDAKAIAGIIIGQRGDRLPTITVTMIGTVAARLTQQLNRDLSDRVHVVESHTGLDADCFIEQISHSIDEGGLRHVTTFGLEKIPTQITGAFVLGSSLLGTGRLGRAGFTDPSVMFVLGSATNGVLGQNILAP